MVVSWITEVSTCILQPSTARLCSQAAARTHICPSAAISWVGVSSISCIFTLCFHNVRLSFSCEQNKMKGFDAGNLNKGNSLFKYYQSNPRHFRTTNSHSEDTFFTPSMTLCHAGHYTSHRFTLWFTMSASRNIHLSPQTHLCSLLWHSWKSTND